MAADPAATAIAASSAAPPNVARAARVRRGTILVLTFLVLTFSSDQTYTGRSTRNGRHGRNDANVQYGAIVNLDLAAV